ncbi:MAG TPA: hypothetical protein VGD78_01050 [Chthoniobacterales bacterium]
MQPFSSPSEKSFSSVYPRFHFKVTVNPHFAGGAQAECGPNGGCSVVVEVEPEETIGAFRFGFPTRTAWHIAEEVAQQAALQAVQKDFPHGFEPVCLSTPLARLPDELRDRHPIARTCQARSWLV